MKMKDEYNAIHNALHNPNQHSVEVHGIHRIIKKTKGGKRYTFLQHNGEEVRLTAVGRNVTLVTGMLMGFDYKPAGKLVIKGKPKSGQ